MSSWTEGALALIIVAGVGVGLFVFTGESLGDGDSAGYEDVIVWDVDAAARGATLAQEQGCFDCHTTDGSQGSGPTWKGLASSVIPLTGGGEVTVDDNYLFNSIVDPANQIVEGYENLMPRFYADQLNDDQITDLVEYIKSLAA
ncbi:MAG TPA: cytochrome c [Acidimicrobiia bacterium]|nr:cytochrome c [Acidimicrobiia bacterium]